MAQFGSALRSGRRGRRFESCHPDHLNFESSAEAGGFLITRDYVRGDEVGLARGRGDLFRLRRLAKWALCFAFLLRQFAACRGVLTSRIPSLSFLGPSPAGNRSAPAGGIGPPGLVTAYLFSLISPLLHAFHPCNRASLSSNNPTFIYFLWRQALRCALGSAILEKIVDKEFCG